MRGLSQNIVMSSVSSKQTQLISAKLAADILATCSRSIMSKFQQNISTNSVIISILIEQHTIADLINCTMNLRYFSL